MPPDNVLLLQRDAEHLQRLGPTPLAGFLKELATGEGIAMPGIIATLNEYRRLTPEMVRAAGGDQFPPRQLHEVPHDLIT